MFWRGKGNGYTTNPDESDVVGIEFAVARTFHCGTEKGIQFVGVKQEKGGGG
jgi:hypothetical protein